MLRTRHGFIALTSVLIIQTVTLAIVLAVGLRSVGESNMSGGEQQSHRALALANLCAELAMMRLESVLQYAGNQTITVGSDTCQILTIEGSGNLNRKVKTQSTIAGYTKKMNVTVTRISPSMQITSWKEVN